MEQNHEYIPRKRKHTKCSVDGCSRKGVWDKKYRTYRYRNGLCLYHNYHTPGHALSKGYADKYRRKYAERHTARNMEELDIVWWTNMAWQNIKRHVRAAELGKLPNYKNVVGPVLDISRSEFSELVMDNSSILQGMWKEYRDSGFDNKLRISVDRIDNTVGYRKDNIQFITLSENAKKAWKDGAFARKRRVA